jgi:transmembrane sensor
MTSMTDWFSNNVSDVVMDDAASWMAILDSERCNMSDRVAFAQWLDEDPSHRWAFEELSEVWAKLRILNELEPLLEQPNVVRLPSVNLSTIPQSATRQQAPPSDWSTMAVALLIGVGSILHFALASPSDEFITGVGESRDIALSDGSMLELNTRTSMLVSIDEQQRRVELLDGEAVFHVAHDSRPFVVATEYGDVVALGTSFIVEINDGSLEVSVIEGQVSVTTNADQAPLIDYDATAGHQFSASASTLEAGDWLEVSASHHRRQFLGTEEFRKRLSWRNGVVVFEDQPLFAVVEEMRRYTNTSIQLADSYLGDLRISGEYQTSDVTQFLAQLQDNYQIVVDAQYADWILLRAASN